MFRWWADLAGQGWVGTATALWIATVLSLAALTLIELGTLAKRVVFELATSAGATRSTVSAPSTNADPDARTS